MNSNPFCLYESVEGWQEATNDIAGVIKAQVNLVKQNKIDPDDGWKEIRAVLLKYEAWGGLDTEPRNICHKRYWDAIDA